MEHQEKYPYDDFCNLISQDDILHKLSDRDKHNYYDFLYETNVSTGLFYYRKDELNRFNIIDECRNIYIVIYQIYSDNPEKFIQIVDLFCNKLKVDINQINYNATPLLVLVRSYYYSKNQQILSCIDILLDYGADINIMIRNRTIIDFVREADACQNLNLYDHIMNHLSPEIKDPGYN
jgi:hypothetical protein